MVVQECDLFPCVDFVFYSTTEFALNSRELLWTFQVFVQDHVSYK